MQHQCIAVLVGSLRRESMNRQLAQALIQLAPPRHRFQFIDLGSLPLYNQDHEGTPPPPVRELKDRIEAADGVLIVTPEYNRSLPGVLKSAIDHASRPFGMNSFDGKPVGVIGVSPGAAGTALAQQHLRNILAYLNAPTLGQPEAFVQFREDLFDNQGRIGLESHRFLQSWMDHFVAWVAVRGRAPVKAG